MGNPGDGGESHPTVKNLLISQFFITQFTHFRKFILMHFTSFTTKKAIPSPIK